MTFEQQSNLQRPDLCGEDCEATSTAIPVQQKSRLFTTVGLNHVIYYLSDYITRIDRVQKRGTGLARIESLV